MAQRNSIHEKLKYLRNRKLVNHFGKSLNVYVLEVPDYQRTLANWLGLSGEFNSMRGEKTGAGLCGAVECEKELFEEREDCFVAFNGKGYTRLEKRRRDKEADVEADEMDETCETVEDSDDEADEASGAEASGAEASGAEAETQAPNLLLSEEEVIDFVASNDAHNALETALMYHCGKVAQYFEDRGYTIISVSYPRLFVTHEKYQLKPSGWRQAHAELPETAADMRGHVQTVNDLIVPLVVSKVYSKLLQYNEYDTRVGVTTEGVPEFEGDNGMLYHEFEVQDLFSNLNNPPKRVKYKQALAGKVWENYIDDIMFTETVHEIFHTDQFACYAFFDIDVDKDELFLKYFQGAATEKWVLQEVRLFNEELNGYFGAELEFAASFSIRHDKISVHMVSTNAMVTNLKQFKALITRAKFQTIFGRHVDPQVYRNNGMLRLAGTMKERQRFVNAKGQRMWRLFPETRLRTLTVYERRQHFVCKPARPDAVILTGQTSFYREFAESSSLLADFYTTVADMGLTSGYGRYAPVLDRLVDMHFTYDNCVGNYSTFFIFTYIVAAISEGSEKYKKVLKDRLLQMSQVKNKSKVTSIEYNFRRHRDYTKDHNLHRSINFLLRKYGIASAEQVCCGENVEHREVSERFLQSISLDEFVKGQSNKMFIKSEMGTGKTEMLMHYLATKPACVKVLLVCTRKSMILEFKKRLERLGLRYLALSSADSFRFDVLKPEHADTSIVISTCESLWRLDDYYSRFDLVVCDEFESVSAQMCSKQTHCSKIEFNNKMLQDYIKGGKLLAMDGLLTTNIIKLAIKPDDRAVLVHNTFKVGKNVKRVKTLAQFVGHLVATFRQNPHIAVACDSKLVSISLYETLSGRKYEGPFGIHPDFILYNSDTSSCVDILNVDMAGKTIIYTPSMDVSVSITDFSPTHVFGFFVNGDVSIFSKLQMMMRFRNTTDIVLYMREFGKEALEDVGANMLFSNHFDKEFNSKDFEARKMFKHFNDLKKFNFQQIEKREKAFLNLMKEKDYYVYQYHEAFKRTTPLDKLIKVTILDPAIQNLEDFQNFKEVQDNNKEYYFFTRYIDKICDDIKEKMEYFDNDVNATIRSTVLSYSNFKTGAGAEHVDVMRVAVYNVYRISDVRQRTFLSLRDFKETFLSTNSFIKVFFDIIKSVRKHSQLLLCIIFKSIKQNEGGRNFVDYHNVLDFSHKVNTKYFSEMSLAKVRRATNKYFTNMRVVDTKGEGKREPRQRGNGYED